MPRPTDRQNRFRPLSWPFPSFPASALAFLLLGFTYVWLRLEPSVQYRCWGTPFFLSDSFFREFLRVPGGLLDYAAAFLAQLNRYDWLGGLVFVGLGCSLFLGARAVCSRLSGSAPLAGGFAPIFLLLWLWGRQDGHALAAGLGVALALGLAVAYMALPWQCAWLRLAACWVFSGLAAGLGGLWPSLLVLTLCWWFEHAVRRPWRWILGPGFLLAGVAAPWALIRLTDLPASRVLNPWGAGASFWVIAALFLCVPLAALALALLPKPTPSPKEAAGPRRKEAGAVPWGRRLRAAAKPALAPGLFLAGWGAVWFAQSGAERAFERIEYYSGRKEFDKVLAVAAPLPVLDHASEVWLRLALYHAGRLSDDLFAYTNQTSWDLLPGLTLGFKPCRAQCDTLMELGQVNVAEHLAHEALELEGNRPDILRLLAQINILKNRPKAARVFLNLLAEVPFERAWADGCLGDLDTDPLLPGDKALALTRSRMVTTDLPHGKLPAESLFLQLLGSNPRNQMAFDYLLAQYFVTRDLDRLIKQVGRLDDFGYTTIPRHLEEAIILYESVKRVPVDLHGRQIHPETVRRFREFAEALKRAHKGRAERQALARGFRDTFWFHFYTRPVADQ